MQIFIAPCGRVPYLIKTFWLEPRLAKDASLSPSARQPCDWFQPLRVKLAVDLLKSEGFAGGGGGGHHAYTNWADKCHTAIPTVQNNPC